MNRKEFARVKSNLIKSILTRRDDYNRIHLPVSAFWNRDFECIDIQRPGIDDSFIYVYLNEYSNQIEVWESYPDFRGEEIRLGIFEMNNIEGIVDFVFNCLFSDDKEEKRKIDWGKLILWIFVLTGCGIWWYWITSIVMSVGN